MKRTLWLTIGAMLMLCTGAASALAQGYPDRPLRLIVPFPAGGGVDTMARILANKLTDVVKQPVLVEHKPGAGGNVGSDLVAKSPPDGYTMLLNVNGIAISPSLYRKLSFDPLKDLVGVTQVAATQFLLTGSPKLEAKTVQEVIALAHVFVVAGDLVELVEETFWKKMCICVDPHGVSPFRRMLWAVSP